MIITYAITDLISGTKLKGLISGTGSFVSTLGSILVFGVIAAMIVGLVWLYSNRRKYNIPTPIFSRRSGVLKYFVDKAAYTKDKKTNLWDFRFRSLKEIASPPPYKCLLTGVRGNNVAIYYQNSAGELYPCEVEIIEPEENEEKEIEVQLPGGKIGYVTTKVATCKLKIIEPDIALWGSQMSDKLEATYGNKTWWDKYGNHLMFFGAAVLTIVLLYLVMKKIDVVQEAAQLFKDAAEILKSSGTKAASSAP